MAKTKIKNLQIKDLTITRTKLVADFLAGSNWDITNGANNFTITGLAAGSQPNDAVNFAQLDALASSLATGVVLQGAVSGASDLTGSATGNAYIDANAGYKAGDLFCVSANGTLTLSDGTIDVYQNDKFYIVNDVASNSAITIADIHVQDNTEDPNNLMIADVIDNLTTSDPNAPLSAQQGVVLDGRVAAIEAFGIPVYSELPTVTTGSPTLGALANTPVTGTQQVYLNGIRQEEGASCDYTLTGNVITFTDPLIAGDKVLVDYRR